jgi:hypothetical protein
MVMVVVIACVLVGLSGIHSHGLFCLRGLEEMDVVLV